MTTGTEQGKPADEAAPDRRGFFKAAALGAVAGAAHGKFGAAPISPAQAQGAPAAGARLSERPWWPSRWGAGDEAGASNHITPAKVLEAVAGIRDGTIYKLAAAAQAGLLVAARDGRGKPGLIARYYVLTTAALALGLYDWLRHGTTAGWEAPEGTR